MQRNDAGDLLVEVLVLDELVVVPESQYGLGCGGGRLCRDRVFHLDGHLFRGLGCLRRTNVVREL